MRNSIKTTKGKVTVGILCILITVGTMFGLAEYMKYQESIKSNVVFTDITEVGLSEDLMNLIVTYDADTVAVNRIVDANEKVVDEPTIGNYTIVFEAVSNGHATEFKKAITFIDDEGPEILGTSDREIDYAAEINLLDGVTAKDNVDGIVEVTSTPLNNKLVGIQPVEYTAKDAAGNESKLIINVTIKEPACAVNAKWNGEDCICSSGYSGDGWSACKVVQKKTTTTVSSYLNKGSTSSSTQSSGSGSTSSGGLSWELEVPSQEALDKLYQEVMISMDKEIHGEQISIVAEISRSGGNKFWGNLPQDINRNIEGGDIDPSFFI